MEKQLHSYKTKPRTRAERRQKGNYLKSLAETTPLEWTKRLAKLNKIIRPEVARVIWWDFFGGKECTKAWTDLDEFMYVPCVDVPRKTIVEALVKCGYSEHHANKRISNTWEKKEPTENIGHHTNDRRTN